MQVAALRGPGSPQPGTEQAGAQALGRQGLRASQGRAGRRAGGPSRAAEPARVSAPGGKCARARASSNPSGQVETNKVGSPQPERSTPPPSWFDPRPGRSETRFARLRLPAAARYRQGKGAPPREGRLPGGHDLVAREPRGPGVPGDHGGRGERGRLQGQPRSPRAGPGREARGRHSPASL